MSTATVAPAVTGTAAAIDPKRFAYLSAVNGKGVNAVRVEWTSEVKPAAAHKARSLRKHSSAVVMTGVEYKALAVNAERETGALPWGEWAVYPFIVTHKGTDYARLYTVDGTVRTTYFVDDAEVDRDTFLAFLTPSQREASRPNGGTITVKMDNLVVLV